MDKINRIYWIRVKKIISDFSVYVRQALLSKVLANIGLQLKES
jgi:hypothetical protein